MTVTVIASTDGVQLSAVLDGDPATARAVILFAHGWTGNKDEAYGYFKRLAENLLLHNIASLRFDARGHGVTALPDGIPFTLAGYRDDIQTCREWLRQHYPNIPVILFGFSLGGLAALQLNKTKQTDYSAIIATCPGLNGADLLDRLPEFVGMLENDLRPITPQRLALQQQGIITVLQGGEDDVCLPIYAEEFSTHCPHAKFKLLPHMGHLYVELADEDNSERFYNRSPQSEDNLWQITQLILDTVS